MSFTNRDKPSQPPVNRPQTTLVFQAAGLAPDLLSEGALAEVLREMAVDWDRGARTPAEEWLKRHPRLAANPETAVQIVYEEICLREEKGEEARSDEILRRFPQWDGALRMLFDCHRLIQSDDPAPRFPKEGERLGELQLVRRLGRGALGQVFLATQPSLSDRPLVVKLTPRVGEEHLSLARLQHTHIVPLYHVLDFPAQHLRALCMPYLGGVTWANLLTTFRGQPLDHRSGRAMVDALDAAEADLPIAANRTGRALGFLSRSTYTQAVCWIGACMADALHYAHESGLVHLDIKPSNILLAGDGQPMLLDFHLARKVIPAHSGPLTRLGGTRGYMSPEQELATAAVSDGRPLPMAVDGRSDIYSLGATLYESLTGRLPPSNEADSRRYWRQFGPQMNRGLEDIVHKCLAQKSSDRYANAAHLASDLQRHLADLPLSGVPNRSLRERWQKWRRRKPQALAGMVAALLVCAVTIASLAFISNGRVSVARAALEQAKLSMNSRDFATAVEQLEGGWKALHWIPGQGELRKALEAQLEVAHRGRVARAVHDLVSQLRFLDSYDAVPIEDLRQLDAACEKLWKVREKLAPLAGSASRSPEWTALCPDLTDLVISWAGLKARLDASADRESLRRNALGLFDDAESLCGASFALELARRQYEVDRSPGAQSTAALKPQTAGEHDALGRFLFRSDRLAEAADAFQRAIELDPHEFWPYFYLTLCAYRLEDFDRALHAADLCVALSPQSAACYYNRGLCQQMLGRTAESLKDFTRAVQLDPASSVAWLRSGIAHRELRQYSAANADFAKALEHSANLAEVYYQMALVEVDLGHREAALGRLRLALEHDAALPSALALQERLQAIP